MEDALHRISEHPILFALLLFLLGALIFFLARKVLKAALIFAIGFAAVFAYFILIDEEPPAAMKEIADKAGETLKKGAEITKKKAKEVGKKIGEELGKEVKDGVGKAVTGEEEVDRKVD